MLLEISADATLKTVGRGKAPSRRFVFEAAAGSLYGARNVAAPQRLEGSRFFRWQLCGMAGKRLPGTTQRVVGLLRNDNQ